MYCVNSFVNSTGVITKKAYKKDEYVYYVYVQSISFIDIIMIHFTYSRGKNKRLVQRPFSLFLNLLF